MNEDTEFKPPSVRYLNVSAIKAHALQCSKQNRGGKFTRVSEEFITDIQAEVEALVRRFNSLHQPALHAVVDPGTVKFVTGELMEKTQEVFNQCIARMIQEKVQRHPSLGCTLKS